MDALWVIGRDNAAYVAPLSISVCNEQGEICLEHFSSLTPFVDVAAIPFDAIAACVVIVDESPIDSTLLSAIVAGCASPAAAVPRLLLMGINATNKVCESLRAVSWDRVVSLTVESPTLTSVIEQAVTQQQTRHRMECDLKNFSNLAFTAMSSASEMGAVALFAEKVQSVMEQSRLAVLIQSCLSDLQLQGVIQFLFAEDVSIYPVDAGPTSIALLNSARAADARIISHQRFLLFSFEHIQLLVTNAPFDDEERYGRLRDVLAHIASIAEARAKSLKVNTLLHTQQDNAKTVLALIEMAAEANRDAVKAIMTELSESLRVMASCLDLNMEQEAELLELSERALNSLEGLQESNEAIEQQFHLLIQQLDRATQLLTPSVDNNTADTVAPSDSNVELF